MKITPRTSTEVDDFPSLSDMLTSQEEFQACQKLRLKAHIEATQPELAAAYEQEVIAFKHLCNTVLKPTLATVANSVSCDGLQIRLIHDKDDGGIFGFATPGMRLVIMYASPPDIDPALVNGKMTYLGFYGCCPDHAVKVVTEIQGVQPNIQCERLVDYSALSIEKVREILSAFLLQAGVGATKPGQT